MTSALSALERTLRDTLEDPMVRHEVCACQTKFAAMNRGSSRPQRRWELFLRRPLFPSFKNICPIRSELSGKLVKSLSPKLNGIILKKAKNI